MYYLLNKNFILSFQKWVGDFWYPAAYRVIVLVVVLAVEVQALESDRRGFRSALLFTSYRAQLP